MKTLTIQDIKRFGSKAIPDKGASMLIVNSKPKCYMIPPEEFEAMIEELEDMEDLRIVEERKNDPELTFDEVFSKT